MALGAICRIRKVAGKKLIEFHSLIPFTRKP
jgi:hypothetical protein